MLCHQVDFTRWRAANLEPEGYRPETVLYQSAACELIRSSIKRKPGARVLHVGPLHSGLFQFLCPAHPRIWTADPDTPEGDQLLDQISAMSEVFDVIFVWDRLLYLNDSERKELAKMLEQHAAPGSSLLAFSSVRNNLPAKPNDFIVKSDATVEMKPVTTEVVEHPAVDLTRILKGWRSTKSMQLRNSFREHLLVFG